MSKVTEYNQSIIEEFRANNGRVGGPFAGAQLLLLHNRGAKSGAARINPLAYFEFNDVVHIVASFRGAPKNPPWYYNLMAHPEVRVEMGDSEYSASAEVVPEPERSALYDKIAAASDAFKQYQESTERVIPIIRLNKIS